MDFLRFTYDTEMRMVEGQPGIKVRWMRARKDAKPPPFEHPYGSRVWENGWRQAKDRGGFGEVYGSAIKWVEPELDPHVCLDGPFWPEQYRPGVAREDAYDYPALRREAGGTFSGCCTKPAYWPLWRPCRDTPRFPRKIRVTMSGQDGGGCPPCFGTDFLMLRGDDGIWRGNGVFGVTSRRFEATFPLPHTPDNLCNLKLLFDGPEGAFVEHGYNPDVGSPEVIPNPPVLFRWVPSTNGIPNSWFICVPATPLPNWYLRVEGVLE